MEISNEQELQDNLQAIGVGIAAGAILASSSGVIAQPWYFMNRKIELPFPVPHPFLVAVVGSTLVAIAMGKWTKTSLKNKRDRPRI